ncbi:hypothetical protein VaNZ11_008531, partial [Volvox africanus]
MPRRLPAAAKNTPASPGATGAIRPRRGCSAAGDDPATSPGGRARRTSANYLAVRPIVVDNTTTSNSAESSTSNSSESGSASTGTLSFSNTSSIDERKGISPCIDSTSDNDTNGSGSSCTTGNDDDNDDGVAAGNLGRATRKSTILDKPSKAVAAVRHPARRSARREVVGFAKANAGAARAASRLKVAGANTRKVAVVVISTSTSSTTSEKVEDVLQRPLRRLAVRRNPQTGGAVANPVASRRGGSPRTAKNAVASKHDSPSGDSGIGGSDASTAEDDVVRGKVQHTGKAAATTAKGSPSGAAAVAAAAATGSAVVPALGDDVHDRRTPKYTPLSNTGGGLLYKNARAWLPLPEHHVRDWFPAAFSGGSRSMCADAGRSADAHDAGNFDPVLDSSLIAGSRRLRRQFRASPKTLRLSIEPVGCSSRHPRYGRLLGPHDAIVKISRGMEPYNLILDRNVRKALEGCRLLGYGDHPSPQEGRHKRRGPPDGAGVKLFVQLPKDCDNEEEENEEGGQQRSNLKR